MQIILFNCTKTKTYEIEKKITVGWKDIPSFLCLCGFEEHKFKILTSNTWNQRWEHVQIRIIS